MSDILLGEHRRLCECKTSSVALCMDPRSVNSCFFPQVLRPRTRITWSRRVTTLGHRSAHVRWPSSGLLASMSTGKRGLVACTFLLRQASERVVSVLTCGNRVFLILAISCRGGTPDPHHSGYAFLTLGLLSGSPRQRRRGSCGSAGHDKVW